MPPRFAFWTILIDGKPTAFRARDPQELLPTINQLKRTNADVVMKWFARGRLWDSPEAERAADQRPKPPIEKRNRDWRPGGAHKDPRDRFKKKNRPERAWSPDDGGARRDRDKLGPPRENRPWTPKPPGPPRSDRPWTSKPPGPPRGDRPWSGKPRSDRPWAPKPGTPSDRPWQTKPTGPRAQRKPWQGKPAGSGGPRKPWTSRPPSQRPPAGGFRPNQTDPRRRKPKDDDEPK
jgi:23S rRNA pseudouridine2605 synthase